MQWYVLKLSFCAPSFFFVSSLREDKWLHFFVAYLFLLPKHTPFHQEKTTLQEADIEVNSVSVQRGNWVARYSYHSKNVLLNVLFHRVSLLVFLRLNHYRRKYHKHENYKKNVASNLKFVLVRRLKFEMYDVRLTLRNLGWTWSCASKPVSQIMGVWIYYRSKDTCYFLKVKQWNFYWRSWHSENLADGL